MEELKPNKKNKYCLYERCIMYPKTKCKDCMNNITPKDIKRVENYIKKNEIKK